MEMVLAQLGLVSAFVERGIELLKRVSRYNEIEKLSEYKEQIGMGLSLVGNLALCAAWHIDLFSAAGFQFAPIAGELLTGGLAWLGSEVIHEVVELLKMFRAGQTK